MPEHITTNITPSAPLLLAFDIGNTTVLFAGLDGERVIFKTRFPTVYNQDRKRNYNLDNLDNNQDYQTGNFYANKIRDILFENHILQRDFQFLSCIISSVVPPVSREIQDAVYNLTNQNPLIVGPDLNTGLKFLIDAPEKLGADRIALAAGAFDCYPPPLILIDMGTATTIDILEPPNIYPGGIILPGVQISLDALTSRTAQLPELNLYQDFHNFYYKNNINNKINQKIPLIGKNTMDCIRAGGLYGSAAALDGLLDRIESEIRHPSRIIAAGGLSEIIVPLCRHSIEIHPDLLLYGLRVLYNLNHSIFHKS